jgi:hypothetical protein
MAELHHMLGTKEMFFSLPELVTSDVARLPVVSIAASINALNSGCPVLGVEVNSG